MLKVNDINTEYKFRLYKKIAERNPELFYISWFRGFFTQKRISWNIFIIFFLIFYFFSIINKSERISDLVYARYVYDLLNKYFIIFALLIVIDFLFYSIPAFFHNKRNMKLLEALKKSGNIKEFQRITNTKDE